MDILLISHFGSTYSENDNDRFLYLAKMLQANNQVEIITSSFCHEKKNHRKKTEYKWPFSVTFLNEIGYKKNVCLKRFLSHFIWGVNLRKYLKQRKKPDVIYCAVPSLTGPYFVAKYCKKNNVKFIIDIQDLWPEAFKMVFGFPIISDLIFFPFTFLAEKIYKNADEIVAVSQTYVNRALLVNNKCSVGYSVFLGTDLESFDNNIKKAEYIEKNSEEIWMGYCGTLGSSYDLPCVFNALRLIEKPITFVVMGDGPQKEEFEKLAEGLGVVFTGRLPYNEICSILSDCDIVVNPIVAKSVASIINKHADYAACGVPVLNTQNSKEYIELVDEYQMGYNIKSGDSNDLANKITLLLNDKQLRIKMGKNARKCAEERFNREYTYKKLIDLIEKREDI